MPLVPRDLVGPSVSRVDGIEFAQPLIASATPAVVAISAVSPTAAGSPPSATEPEPALSEPSVSESVSEPAGVDSAPDVLDLGSSSRRGEE